MGWKSSICSMDHYSFTGAVRLKWADLSVTFQNLVLYSYENHKVLEDSYQGVGGGESPAQWAPTLKYRKFWDIKIFGAERAENFEKQSFKK